MNAQSMPVNIKSTAPLQNVAAMLSLVETLRSRSAISEGLATFSGYSGYGKTYAARYAQNRYQAVYIEVRSFWTKKTVCQSLLAELSVERRRGTIADMMQAIIERLAQDPEKIVLIDEADVLVDKNMIELVRDIHDMARTPIVLIGEEQLPSKLKRFERVDNRVLERVLAQPCNLNDAATLAGLICPQITVCEKLLQQIVDRTHGRTRRVANTLHTVATVARNKGLGAIDAADFDAPIDTGEIPSRRGIGGGRA